MCSIRLHCTMIRHDEDSNVTSGGTCYTLYLEYLGGLVPLLKGKRTSKIRPEFVIFDPQVNGNAFLHHLIISLMMSLTNKMQFYLHNCLSSKIRHVLQRLHQHPVNHIPVV